MTRISGAKTSATMDINFMRMFREGPDVSLKGSPTVSPTTVALWASEPFPAEVALLNVLLCVYPQGPAGVRHRRWRGGTRMQASRRAGRRALQGRGRSRR